MVHSTRGEWDSRGQVCGESFEGVFQVFSGELPVERGGILVDEGFVVGQSCGHFLQVGVDPAVEWTLTRDFLQLHDESQLFALAKEFGIDLCDADGAERKQREEWNLMLYVNADGMQSDFHALRHTFVSRLSRSGASAKAMQTLARHSTPELTLNRYAHASVYDLASAVNGLQPLPGKPNAPVPQRQTLRATRTEDGYPMVTVKHATQGDSLSLDETDEANQSAAGRPPPASRNPLQVIEETTTKDEEKSGEGEIRTPGEFPHAGFQDRCNRPLCHLSGCLLVLGGRAWCPSPDSNR